MRSMPSMPSTRSRSAARSVGGSRSRPYALTVWPSSVTSRQPAAASPRISSTIASGAWLRSRPRVIGTTQNVQCFSQPSITVTKAFSRLAAVRPAVILTSGAFARVEHLAARPRRTRPTSSPDPGDGGRAEDEVDVGRPFLDAPLLELRHAAHHADDEVGPVLLEALQRAELREDLVLRLFADRTGIEQDQVGVLGRSRSSYWSALRSPATRSESYSFIWQP